MIPALPSDYSEEKEKIIFCALVGVYSIRLNS